MLMPGIMKMKDQNVETLILETFNNCSAFPIKINSRKLQLIRENVMVAILIGRWQLSTNEGIARKHY